ncbi:MAG: RidA family protein [Pseudomonadota bacterium]
MPRDYSWPEGHWGWPVPLTHKHGVRADRFIFTGGQADLDAQGQVVHPNDLQAQVDRVFDYMHAVLADLGADTRDLVRLVVYYVGDHHDEARILALLGARLDGAARPVVNTIPVPELCYPGMRIELEGVALRAVAGCHEIEQQCIRLESLPALAQPFSHLVVVDDLVFTSDMSAVSPEGTVAHPGDMASQTETMMAQLESALRAAGAGFDDVLKLNTFYVGQGTAEDWERPALIRQSCFRDPGPAATGIPLPALGAPGLLTKIAATAARTPASSRQTRPTRQFSWPDGHWNWTTALPYKHGNRYGKLIHLGGQVSLDRDARVIDPDDMVAQTTRALSYIETVLADLGATLDDVVKVTTFYQGNASAHALHENLCVRSRAFTDPGPATSGIPVPSLVYQHMCVEIEVIAVVDA